MYKMMKKRRFLPLLTAVLLFTLSGCNATVTEDEKLHSPRVFCTEISYYNNEKPEIRKYCTLQPSDSVLSLSEELSTETGSHTVSYVISDGQHNNFTTGTLNYTVQKYIPPCPDNATYNEETERCECNSGYVSIHGSCELKVTCSSGYKYNESTNTCEIQPIINPSGNGSSGGGGSAAHGSEYFMFSSGYDIDTAYQACVIRGKQFSSYSCVSLKDDEGFYIGYRLDY